MKIIEIVLVTAITVLLTASAEADSMRCGAHVIEDGELHNIPTMDEVVKKCGQPSSRESSTLYYKNKGKRLHFDTDGRLISIEDMETEGQP